MQMPNHISEVSLEQNKHLSKIFVVKKISHQFERQLQAC